MARAMLLPPAIANKPCCWSFYLFGGYRGTGGKLKIYCRGLERRAAGAATLLAHPQLYGNDFWRQHLFGGRPIYLLMLIRRLAPDFIVWDKAARIEFSETRPGNFA